MSLRRPASCLVALFATLAVLVTAGVAGAPAARAHDVLHSTSPTDGSTVATVPDSIVLTFDEPALAIGSTIRVTGPSGDVQAGAPHLVDDTVTQDLVAGAVAGSYRVAWRVTSADGHPVSGEFGFVASGANARALGTSVVPPATTSATAPAVTGATTSSGSGSTPIIVIAVVLVLLVAAALALTLGTRRSRSGVGADRRDDDGDEDAER